MKTQSKQLPIFLCLLAVFFTPIVAYSRCDNKPVYIENPKMEWHLDTCGQWRQGYGWSNDEDYNNSDGGYVSPDNSDPSTWNQLR